MTPWVGLIYDKAILKNRPHVWSALKTMTTKRLRHMAASAVKNQNYRLARKVVKAALLSIPELVWESYQTKKDRAVTIPRTQKDRINDIFRQTQHAWIFENGQAKEVTGGTVKRRFTDQQAVMKQIDHYTFAVPLNAKTTCILTLES